MSSERDDILRECLARERDIEATPKPAKGNIWALREWEDQQEYGPPFSVPEWFGDEDNFIPERYRSRYLRALWQAHDDGLLIGTRTGARLSNVKLTEAGRKLAEELSIAEEAS